jgi:hypothetical protein
MSQVERVSSRPKVHGVLSARDREIVPWSIGLWSNRTATLCIGIIRSRIRREIERLRESGVARLSSITTPKGYA